MAYALTPALYIAIILCIISSPVMLFLIYRKLSVCEQTLLDWYERMFWMSKHDNRREQQNEQREAAEERRIVELLERIAVVLERAFFPIFKITQLDGGNMSKGTGAFSIPVGGTGTFGETDPAGFVDSPGAVRSWGSDDSVNTSLTPSPDANKTTVAVAVSKTATVGGTFNLSYVDTDSTGKVIGTSGPLLVTFGPAAVAVADFVVNQLS
jgi:hypothetical protein